MERAIGIAASRKLPAWRADRFRASAAALGPEGAPEVVLFADTFNTNFQPEKLDAALRVLIAAGYSVHMPAPADGGSRPVCCGRTFLSAGLVEEARAEARRAVDTFAPFAVRGVPIVGLEPSCLLTFRDEIGAMRLGPAAQLCAGKAELFEEFVVREREAGRFRLELGSLATKALLHGHCHQKSFGTMDAVERCLRLVPDLSVETVESSCCGMAGSFGYQAETVDVSRAMGELSLLPAVRAADEKTLIVADGFSCRCQIEDGTKRDALHVAEIMAMALDVRSNESANAVRT
jgi:Fe-S oxidoreductase